MELLQAHKQWANRPDDERFDSLESLHAAALIHRAKAAETNDYPYATLRVQAAGEEVLLIGKERNAHFTNWAFNQLAARIQAPASYLRELPPTLAAQNLNHGLATRGQLGDKADLLWFNDNGERPRLRAITSDKYSRIWNSEITERLIGMKETGRWEVARPDIRVIDNKLPLYLSDHDMFAFLHSTSKTVTEPGRSEPLYRGFICSNSEVGAAALKVTRFLYREMCGNHIIWGASRVCELSLRHIGDIRNSWQKFAVTLKSWDDEATDQEDALIRKATGTLIAETKQEVLDVIFGKKVLGLSRKAIEASYDAVVGHEDGDARSVWGFVQGATRHSQTLKNADERTEFDRAAGKLLQIDF